MSAPSLKRGGILIGLLLLLMTALQAATSYDSDAAFKRQFRQHRADYQKIVQMAQHDGDFVAISSEFTKPDTDDTSSEKQNWISRERLADYRALFRRIRVPDGIRKNEEDIFFANTARGFILSSSYKGIVYCPRAP
jgi:hypothetical protein